MVMFHLKTAAEIRFSLIDGDIPFEEKNRFRVKPLTSAHNSPNDLPKIDAIFN